MSKTRAEIIVHGRVQGVFFRQSTVEMARTIGLTGLVRNCPDGTVAAIPLGKDGLWCKLYAAVRKEDAAQAYVKAFFETARLTSIQHLPNIVLL